MAIRRKKVYDKYVGNDDDDDDDEVGVTEDGDDTEDSDDAGTAVDDEDAGEDGSPDTSKTKDPIAKAIADTEARMRHKYIKPLKAQLAQLQQDDSNSKNLAAVVETVRTLRMENEFLRLAGGTFHDAAAAFKLADTTAVQIDDKGTITGMDAVVGQLATSHPYLVRDDADDLNLYDDDAPDVPSGRPMNGRRQATGPANNDAALVKKYPALRRYGQ